MCGRYTHLYTWRQLHRLMTLTTPPLEFEPRYNVAPTQAAPVVRQEPGGGRSAALLQWGLVPSWAKDPSIGNSLINARAETVADKPAFRAAFKSRRCIVPVSGFYEWKGPKGSKGRQPFYIVPERPALGSPGPVAAQGNSDTEHACADPRAGNPSERGEGAFLLFPGLWESWRTPEGIRLETYVIITVAANDWMKPLHDRIPAMLAPGPEVDAWLNPATPVDELSVLLHPPGEDWLRCWPVSSRVNRPVNEDPSLIEPLDPLKESGPPQGLFG